MSALSPAEHPPPDLSVVVVTYNEAERIGQCLDAVISACDELVADDESDVAAYEMILVDSKSTDNTVEIACRYPGTVLQIADEGLTTPGAGRFVGTHAADGEHILFVDGDMVIRQEWLTRALSHLQEHSAVAAVDGELNESEQTDSRTVPSVRGVAVYDAGALASVGGFDPFLQSLEDIHLGFELTVEGYELHRLPCVSAEHPERAAFADPIRRWRQGYVRGPGQVLRRSLDSPLLLRKHFYRLRHRFVLAGWLLAGLLSVAVAPLLWLVLSFAGLAYVVSKLGVAPALSFFLTKSLGIAGLLDGFVREPVDPEQFPLSAVERVQIKRPPEAVE